jgi:hypothetical protein
MPFRSLARTLLVMSLTSAAVPGMMGCDQPTTPEVAQLADASQVRVERIDVQGREIRFQLAEPLAQAALAHVRPELEVSGPDLVAHQIRTRAVAASARIEDDGFVLVMTAPEDLDRANHYDARLLLAGGAVRMLGSVEVPRPSGGARANPVRVTDMKPADGQGMFSTDRDLAARVSREQELLRITFSQPVDCAELKRQGDAALIMYTTGSNHPPGFNHYLFHNPDAPVPDTVEYSGHVTCSGDQKIVTLHIPGRLYGGTEYKVHIHAPLDASGHYAQTEDFSFKTENPGLRVKVKTVANHLAYNCERSLFNGPKRCDVYIAMVGSWIDPRPPFTAHETVGTLGTWNNWLRSDYKYPDYTWMETTGPVGDDVLLISQAFDADGNESAVWGLRIAASIHAAVAAVMTASGNVYAAIPAAVGTVLEGIAEVIHNNGDDKLGTDVITLSRNGENTDLNHVASWWGMYRDRNSEIDPWEPLFWQDGRKAVVGTNKHGDIHLHYLVEEIPSSWMMIPRVL